jgi:hypothetical protein
MESIGDCSDPRLIRARSKKNVMGRGLVMQDVPIMFHFSSTTVDKFFGIFWYF